MCRNCEELPDFPSEAIVLAEGFAIGFVPDSAAPVGPEAVLPITAFCVSGTPMANMDSGVEAWSVGLMDLNGLAQLKVQIEHHIKTMDAETSARFVHLYDQQACRVRDFLND